MSKSEKVVENLNKGYNCAQAIMEAFAADYGLSSEQALKLSLNMGGGFAFRGEICGAVSTALLIYSLHFGTARVNEELSEEILYHLSSEHTKEFTGIYGGVNCSKLLGHDITNPEDFAGLMEDPFFRLKCSRFVMDSVRILERNIRETESKIKQ